MLDSDGLAAGQFIEGAGVLNVGDVRLDRVKFLFHPLHIGRNAGQVVHAVSGELNKIRLGAEPAVGHNERFYRADTLQLCDCVSNGSDIRNISGLYCKSERLFVIKRHQSQKLDGRQSVAFLAETEPRLYLLIRVRIDRRGVESKDQPVSLNIFSAADEVVLNGFLIRRDVDEKLTADILGHALGVWSDVIDLPSLHSRESLAAGTDPVLNDRFDLSGVGIAEALSECRSDPGFLSDPVQDLRHPDTGI